MQNRYGVHYTKLDIVCHANKSTDI